MALGKGATPVCPLMQPASDIVYALLEVLGLMTSPIVMVRASPELMLFGGVIRIDVPFQEDTVPTVPEPVAVVESVMT